MAKLPAFASALQAWFVAHPHMSVRRLEHQCDISNLSQYRSGARAITLEAISKLLPAIQGASSRQEAITLLLAYLRDETPPEYASDIRIEAVDQASGQSTPDTYAARAEEWESKARQDPKFNAVWAGLTDFIMHPEKLLDQPLTSPEAQADEIAQGIGGKVTLFKTGQGEIPIIGPQTTSGPAIAAEEAQQQIKAAIQKTAQKVRDAAAKAIPPHSQDKSDAAS